MLGLPYPHSRRETNEAVLWFEIIRTRKTFWRVSLINFANHLVKSCQSYRWIKLYIHLCCLSNYFKYYHNSVYLCGVKLLVSCRVFRAFLPCINSAKMSKIIVLFFFIETINPSNFFLELYPFATQKFYEAFSHHFVVMQIFLSVSFLQ